MSRPTAWHAAEIVGVNLKTEAHYFHQLLIMIIETTRYEIPIVGKVEVDKSYFGEVRKGKRGQDAAGKVLVFGLLKPGSHV